MIILKEKDIVKPSDSILKASTLNLQTLFWKHSFAIVRHATWNSVRFSHVHYILWCLTIALEENYGSVLRDCSKAITINPRSSKAFYRSALALIALERVEEALDCCDRCLSFDQDNQGIQIARKRASEAKVAKDRRESARFERIQKEINAKRLLHAAFHVCGIFFFSNENDLKDPSRNEILSQSPIPMAPIILTSPISIPMTLRTEL